MKGRHRYRDEALLAQMPAGQFTAKDLGLGPGTGGMLAHLEDMGRIKRVGRTGPLGRIALWEKA